MELYLIRHPAVAVPPGTCYGASNVDLAEPVDRVAARLAPLLPQDALYISSPLLRCRVLAEALSSKVDFEPRLAEMDFGAWEMCAFDDIPMPMIDAWAANPFGFCPPGGESVRDMAQRVWQAWDDIQAAAYDRPVVLLSHGGPLRALAAQFLQLPESRWLSLDFACGQASLFVLESERVTLKWFNRG